MASILSRTFTDRRSSIPISRWKRRSIWVEAGRLRLRYAAFNFINHPLNSFGTGYASQTTLQLSDTSPNGSPETATYNPSEGFGSAPLKLGTAHFGSVAEVRLLTWALAAAVEMPPQPLLL